MELTWHGHSTWAVTVGETEFLIDPFFDNPYTDLSPESMEDPDYILLTHGHADHIAHTGVFDTSTVVGVPELVGFVEDEYKIEDTIGMNIGGTIECGDAYVTMHRADHTSGIETGYNQSAGMPAGYLISDTDPTAIPTEEGTTFYHAGDTGLMSEMREVIGEYLQPDIAALPIGDHFTMGPKQAAIAADWLDLEYVLPMHYDTFPPIEVNPERFEQAVEKIASGTTVKIIDGDETIAVD